MKKRLYIKTAFLALATATLLSSCLKDDAHYVDFADSTPLVELPAASGVGPSTTFTSSGTLVPAALPASTADTTIGIEVNVAASKPLSKAITVKLSLNEAAISAFNTAKSTSYTLMPSADYSSTLTVTIPANQYSANLMVTVHRSLLSTSFTKYVLPLTITDGGGQQISNYKTVLYNIYTK